MYQAMFEVSTEKYCNHFSFSKYLLICHTFYYLLTVTSALKIFILKISLPRFVIRVLPPEQEIMFHNRT